MQISDRILPRVGLQGSVLILRPVEETSRESEQNFARLGDVVVCFLDNDLALMLGNRLDLDGVHILPEDEKGRLPGPCYARNGLLQKSLAVVVMDAEICLLAVWMAISNHGASRTSEHGRLAAVGASHPDFSLAPTKSLRDLCDAAY